MVAQGLSKSAANAVIGRAFPLDDVIGRAPDLLVNIGAHAFVQMNTVDEAKRAVEELHDKEFLGRKLVVSGAKSSEHHSAN